MRSLALISLAALLASGCAAEARPARTPLEGPAASCDIRAVRSGGMVELTAFVRARTDVAGAFDFRVRKNDAEGATAVMQGGGFTARAGETVTLAQAGLSPAHWKAELVLSLPGGPVRCKTHAKA